MTYLVEYSLVEIVVEGTEEGGGCLDLKAFRVVSKGWGVKDFVDEGEGVV